MFSLRTRWRVCGQRVIIPNEGFKDLYRGKKKKKEDLTRIKYNIYILLYIRILYIIMRLPGGATMRAVLAWCDGGGGGGWHSNVTTHINGSLGRVIDTKLYRTHLSRRLRLQKCRRIVRGEEVYRVSWSGEWAGNESAPRQRLYRAPSANSSSGGCRARWRGGRGQISTCTPAPLTPPAFSSSRCCTRAIYFIIITVCRSGTHVLAIYYRLYMLLIYYIFIIGLARVCRSLSVTVFTNTTARKRRTRCMYYVYRGNAVRFSPVTDFDKPLFFSSHHTGRGPASDGDKLYDFMPRIIDDVISSPTTRVMYHLCRFFCQFLLPILMSKCTRNYIEGIRIRTWYNNIKL